MCVYVIINKRSFESFLGLDLVLERWQSFMFHVFVAEAIVYRVENVDLRVTRVVVCKSSKTRSKLKGQRCTELFQL